MDYITRNLETVVEQVTKEYPVVLVTGPRQVGKTTMLRKLMEGTDRGYVSLDDLNERSMAKNDPELFLQIHQPPILIDEGSTRRSSLLTSKYMWMNIASRELSG